jgi:hypothetical protein
MTTPIAPHIPTFFEQRLPKERGASENTSNSYAYAFQLLLTFASKRFRVSPSQLAVEQIDAPLVLDFLNDWKPHAVMDQVLETFDWPLSDPSCTSWNIASHRRSSRSGESWPFQSRKPSQNWSRV